MIDCLSLRMITGLLHQPLDRKDTVLDKLTLSMRVQRVKPSPTLAVTARVAELRAAGKDIIGLGAGEPDFATPEHVKAAGRAAIEANYTKYTANAGIPELKAAICERYRSDYGVSFSESEVIVTAGGKQALYNAAMVLFGPGDEVITHAPGWPTIVEQIKMAGHPGVCVTTSSPGP